MCMRHIPGPSILLVVLLISVLAGCSQLFPAGEVEEIDFRSLERPSSSNHYLVCTPAHCQSAVSDRQGPVFATDIQSLRSAWDRIVLRAPRTELVASFGDGSQVAYVQRSAVWQFPDIVSVAFLELPDGRVSLAIYSRSVYGRSDFGANRARISGWLAQLEADLGEAGS